MRSYHQPGQRFVHTALTDPEMLAIGGSTFGFDEVTGYEITSVVERDWQGQILCAAGSALWTSVILILVLLGVLDFKWYLGVGFLAFVTLMGVGDVLGTRPVTLHTLSMTLADSRHFNFVDCDPTVVDALADRIDAATARRRSVRQA
jgi:hypothetical protein